MNNLNNIFSSTNIKFLLFILFICKVCFINAVILKEDSLKVNYPITDPRNPHCACHQYQKLADEEYQNQLGIKITAVNNKLKVKQNEFDSRNSHIKGTSRWIKNGSYFKKANQRLFGIKNKKVIKRRKIKRFKKDNAACFYF